jgi:hypothetical protein
MAPNTTTPLSPRTGICETYCVRERKTTGRDILTDQHAVSSDPSLPAFLARSHDAPVYHGFPLVEESRTSDGWCFGAITSFDDPEGCESGDAFVVAPDGSRAGIVWQVGEGDVREILSPDDMRWGVYAVTVRNPVRTTRDFACEMLAALPRLRDIHDGVNKERIVSARSNATQSSIRSAITFFHVLWFGLSGGLAWLVYSAASQWSSLARTLLGLGAFVAAILLTHITIVYVVTAWVIPRLSPQSHWNEEVDSYMSSVFPGRWGKPPGGA